MKNYQLVKNITLLCYVLLLTTVFFIAWRIGPEQLLPKLSLGLIFNLGLLLVLYGVVKEKRRSYLWLCFILLMYFIAFVQGLFSNGAAWDEIFGLSLVVVGFITSMLAARWSQSKPEVGHDT